MKIYYKLLSIDRIGQVFHELFLIRNLYPEDEVIVITSNPDNHPRLNRQAFDYILTYFKLKCTDNHSFLSSRSPNPYAEDLVKFGDGYLFQKDPNALTRSFWKDPSKEKLKIFFKLNDEQKKAGEFIRKYLGIPNNSKYVTLHVRENGYLPNLKYHSYRDSNIDYCINTIKHLNDNGYYVIRLGDPSMKTLDINSDKYIDLAHSEFTHTFAEVYFISQADFHIGSGSGVYSIAQTCGRPIIYLNTEIPFGMWGTEYDIDLPRICYSQKMDRNMSVPELALSDIMTLFDADQYKKIGIKLIENDQDTILETTKEMISNIKLHNTSTNIDNYYFENIKKLYADMGSRNPRFGYSMVHQKKISECYLRNHPYFLGIPH